mmetsp:Transcript_31206/g.89443  ORF Transcript_31206/g.89443 Transcript_31206/m.89443 type:complete len:312 (+) Transcript_31206:1318-2253(+)
MTASHGCTEGGQVLALSVARTFGSTAVSRLLKVIQDALQGKLLRIDPCILVLQVGHRLAVVRKHGCFHRPLGPQALVDSHQLLCKAGSTLNGDMWLAAGPSGHCVCGAAKDENAGVRHGLGACGCPQVLQLGLASAATAGAKASPGQLHDSPFRNPEQLQALEHHWPERAGQALQWQARASPKQPVGLLRLARREPDADGTAPLVAHREGVSPLRQAQAGTLGHGRQGANGKLEGRLEGLDSGSRAGSTKGSPELLPNPAFEAAICEHERMEGLIALRTQVLVSRVGLHVELDSCSVGRSLAGLQQPALEV